MSERRRYQKEELEGLDGCTVVVCAGPDCSDTAELVIATLGPFIAQTEGAILIRASCVRACQNAPVVIVQRRSGTEPGLAAALTTEPTLLAELGRWVTAGGPGTAPLPDQLHPTVFAAR